MTDVNTLVTDYNLSVTKNIIFDKPQYHSKNYNKIHVYNGDLLDQLQNLQHFWIRVEKLQVYKIFERSDQYLNRSIRLQVIVTGRLKRFLEVFESRIRIRLKNKPGKSALCTITEGDENISVFVINIPVLARETDGYGTIIDNNGLVSTYSCIKSGSSVSALIELSEIWINEEEYGFNWTVMHLRNFIKCDFRKLLFGGQVVKTIVSNDGAVRIEEKKVEPRNKEKEPKNDGDKRFVPTVDQLLSVRLQPVSVSKCKQVERVEQKINATLQLANEEINRTKKNEEEYLKYINKHKLLD